MTSSAPSPRPSAANASRKSLAWRAIRSASTRQSPSKAASEVAAVPVACCGWTGPGSDIERPPSFERAAERDLVGVLEVFADRQAAGGPSDVQAKRLDEAGEIRGGRLTLEVRIG